MKKIILFIAICILGFGFNSCSSSDGQTEIGGVITFKVNGVQKTFDNIYVSENLYFEGTPNEYTELNVFATPLNNSAEELRFYLYKNRLEDFVSFFYSSGDNQYTRIGNFAVHITSNGNNKKLIGTFSGQMGDSEIQPQNFITISQGSFNIQY